MIVISIYTSLVLACSVWYSVLRGFRDPWQIRWESQHVKAVTRASAAAVRGIKASSKTGSSSSSKFVYDEAMLQPAVAAAVRRAAAEMQRSAGRKPMFDSYGKLMVKVCPVSWSGRDIPG